MIDKSKFTEATNEIFNALPASVKGLSDDLKSSVRGVIEEKLKQLQLVTREEFDIQTKVLARTRQKLEQLEQQLTDLTQQQK